MAVNFYIDKRTDKNGDAPIRVSVAIRGARFVTSTGLKITPGKWDAPKQRVRKGCTNGHGITYNVINTELAKIAEYFGTMENEYISRGARPTPNELKAGFAESFGRRTRRTKGTGTIEGSGFFGTFDAFLSEVSEERQWRPSTALKFVSLEGHLRKFDPEASFENFTEKRLGQFVTFLRGQRLRNNTVRKYISMLRWFFRWALKKGVNKNTAFADFAPKMKNAPKKVIFLPWEELQRVYSFEPPEGTGLELPRDVFCLCAFTSLRFSDAMNLKWADIGTDSLTITTIKTEDTITIDLNKYARAVLDRWRNFPYRPGYVFPSMTNKYMNHGLKRVCRLCGIDQPVTTVYYIGSERVEQTRPKYECMTSHAGRRTFICNALMLGIPPQIVMKWTGHSDYKAMKPYIDVTNEAKARQMAKFDEI